MRAPGPGSTGGSRPLPVETPPVHFVWVDAAIACMLAFPPPSDPSKSQPLPENAGGGISRPSSRESSPRAAAATPTPMRGGQSARAREAAACGRWRRRRSAYILILDMCLRRDARSTTCDRLLNPSDWATLAPNITRDQRPESKSRPNGRTDLYGTCTCTCVAGRGVLSPLLVPADHQLTVRRVLGRGGSA